MGIRMAVRLIHEWNPDKDDSRWVQSFMEAVLRAYDAPDSPDHLWDTPEKKKMMNGNALSVGSNGYHTKEHEWCVSCDDFPKCLPVDDHLPDAGKKDRPEPWKPGDRARYDDGVVKVEGVVDSHYGRCVGFSGINVWFSENYLTLLEPAKG